MARKLFDKPMNELREEFVRGRFAEPQHFGREDIEEWLGNQRVCKNPEAISFWDLPHFGKIREGLFARTDELIVLSHTTPTDISEIKLPPFVSIDGGEVKYYSALGSRLLVHGKRIYVVSYARGLRLDAIARGRANLQVYNILLREWQESRPKWREARDFLCSLLAKKISEIRKKAENDFNRAVAVSADGREILHADKVTILVNPADPQESQRWRTFPTEMFLGSKILRSSCSRVKVDAGLDEVIEETTRNYYFYDGTELFRATRSHRKMNRSNADLGGARQVVAKCSDGKVLFTTAMFCPSPLPLQGGRLIG